MAYSRTLQHFTSSQELATVWTSGQDYIVDQLVLDNDKLYRCITAHTSGATFAGDSANWVGINPGDVIDIAGGGTGQTTQTAAFDALAPTTTAGDIIVHDGTDNVRQAIGSDGQVLVVDTAQPNKLKWATIQQGSKNYIPNATFENGVTPPSSWSTFSTTIDSTTKVPSGAITSPDATYTLAVSSSTPLAGTYSMTASTGGTVTVTTTGYGFITAPFTIDAEDKAKPMGFSFYYQAISGSMNFSGTSSNTFAVYIYAVDGTSGWIQPAGVYNLVQSSGAGICSGTFQTTSDSTQYRLAIIMINSVTGSLSMRFDDFQLGPQKTLAGAAVSDWKTFTPTVAGISATASGLWRRVGDSAEFQIALSTSGAASGDIKISVGGEFSFDYTKLSAAAFANIGSASANDGSGLHLGTCFTDNTSTNTFFISGDDGQNIWNATVPFTWAGTRTVSIQLKAPIQGWSSNTVMSSDTDTRVVAASVYPAASQPALTSGGVTKVLFDTLNFGDTHAAFDFANDWYRVPVSGWYQISATVAFGTNNVGARAVGYRIDGTFVRWMTSFQSSTGDTTRCVGSALAYLNAGSYVEIFAFQNSGSALTISVGADNTHFSICRQSGPATIAASETVKAFYRHPGGQSILSSDSTQVVNFSTKVYDSHNAVTTGAAWKFTAPVSGTYRVSAETLADPASGWVANEEWTNRLYIQDGSIHSILGGQFMQTAHSALVNAAGSTTLYMNAGDWFQVRIYQSNGSPVNIRTDPAFNFIAIEKVGY